MILSNRLLNNDVYIVKIKILNNYSTIICNAKYI